MYVQYLIMDGWGVVDEPGGGFYIEEHERANSTNLRLSECTWIVPGTVSIDD